MNVRESLEAAKKALLARRTSVTDFVRGWNDCWAFVKLYDDFRREGQGVLKSLDFTFVSPREFSRHLKEAGINSYKDLADYGGYITVPRPQEGDIAFFRPAGLAVLFGGVWVAPQERSLHFISLPPRQVESLIVTIFRAKE